MPTARRDRRMGTAQIASILGDLKAISERQSCHKLAIRNWNTTSLTANEDELIRKDKRYYLDTVGILSTKSRGSNSADLHDGWKLFYSGVEPAEHVQAEVGLITADRLQFAL